MKNWLKATLLTLVLSFSVMGWGQSVNFFTDRAVGTYPIPGQTGVTALVPVQYGQVRVCNFSATPGIPCASLATITDINGNPLSVSGGNFGQLSTDVVGRFSFGCTPGTVLTIQVAAVSSNTPLLNYPTTCPFASSGSTIDAIFNSVTTGTMTATSVASPSNTLANVDNRIYVDGVKYPLTHAGLQQAINDACALGSGLTPGTTVYLPTGSISSTTGYTQTCPLRIIGAGDAQTIISVTTGPAFTISPSANFSQNQRWEYTAMDVVVSTGDAIFQDTTSGFGITQLYVHDIQLFSPNGWGFNMSNPTIANASFNQVFDRVQFLNTGINFVGTGGGTPTGAADGLIVSNSEFNANGSTNTRPCINLTSMSGAAQWTVFHNRGGCLGGEVISHGTGQCKILDNQFEQPAASTEANSAMIDLLGDIYAVAGCDIIGNNLNAHTFATNNIRVDNAQNIVIDRNVMTLHPTTGVGILTTASAVVELGAFNIYSGLGGGAVGISGAGDFSACAPNFTNCFFNGGYVSGAARIIFTGTQPGFNYEFLNSGNGIDGIQIASMDLFEGNGPGTSATGHARLWADITSHTWKVNNNGGSSFSLTETIASGTATMTTAAIASGACGTTVTVAAANVTTSDVIDFNTNASVTTPNGLLVLHAWPTSGNVNFNYCNSTAASQTPTAATVNWSVRR